MLSVHQCYVKQWGIYMRLEDTRIKSNAVFLSFPADHQNFFGMDERLGPVAISFRREEKEGSSGAQYTYRIIFRTTEVKELMHTYTFMHMYIFFTCGHIRAHIIASKVKLHTTVLKVEVFFFLLPPLSPGHVLSSSFSTAKPLT